jgi:hypothetical protein
MGGEKRHCTHLTAHCTSPVTLEGGYDKVRIPQSQGFRLIHPVSTRPRPGLDALHSSTGKEGRYGAALRVISAPHPLRHHVPRDGLPFLGHASTVLSNKDRQNIVSRPHRPGHLSPYKGRGRGSTRDRRRKQTNNEPHTRSRSTSQAIILYFLFPF